MTYAHMNGKAMTRDELQAAKVQSMVEGIMSCLKVVNQNEEGTETNDDQRVFAAAAMYVFEMVGQSAFDYVDVDFRAKTITYLPIDDAGDTDVDIVIQL